MFNDEFELFLDVPLSDSSGPKFNELVADIVNADGDRRMSGASRQEILLDLDDDLPTTDGTEETGVDGSDVEEELPDGGTNVSEDNGEAENDEDETVAPEEEAEEDEVKRV